MTSSFVSDSNTIVKMLLRGFEWFSVVRKPHEGRWPPVTCSDGGSPRAFAPLPFLLTLMCAAMIDDDSRTRVKTHHFDALDNQQQPACRPTKSHTPQQGPEGKIDASDFIAKDVSSASR
jgi:hypothetical protein